MYTDKDLRHAENIKRLESKIDIAVEAVRDINRALFEIKDSHEIVTKVRDSLSDLELFLMNK